MHIIHLIKTSEGAKWALELLRELRARYHDITFSVLLPKGGRFYYQYFEVCNTVYEFDFKFDYTILKQGVILRQIVLEEKPDIIHTWFAQTTLFSRLFLRDLKIPRIFEVPGPLHLESRLFQLLDKWSAQPFDYWKATSQYTYRKYSSINISKEKLFFNYIGLDLDEYLNTMLNSPCINLRHKYNIPDNTKIIGTASYMYPPKFLKKYGVKNHELLLEVFRKLCLKRDDVILVIGGTTLSESERPYEDKLKKMASEISEDKIIFTGWMENLGRLISEFDVFVFLSLSENLGGVYESLLFQVPTVSSDRGGIPELIVDGETGFSCNLRSVDEIVKKIEMILDNNELKERFKSNGYAKVQEVFNIQKSVSHSYNIYREILNEMAALKITK